MRIIFSKDRPAQLDLLLSSLERNAEPEDTGVILYRSSEYYWQAYSQALVSHVVGPVWIQPAADFEASVREALEQPGDFVTFFCDDDVLFAPLPGTPDTWDFPEDALAFSLRLGGNVTRSYVGDRPQQSHSVCWRWDEAEGDYGYPCSNDGNVYRTSVIREMLDGQHFGGMNTTSLEDLLHQRAQTRPERYLASFERSVLCSVPVNAVSEFTQVRSGVRYPVSAEALNERFLAGWRLDLDALDFGGVDSAHYEVDLEAAWRRS